MQSLLSILSANAAGSRRGTFFSKLIEVSGESGREGEANNESGGTHVAFMRNHEEAMVAGRFGFLAASFESL